MNSVPRFPLTAPIESWDDLTLSAANIYCEAEGEPLRGKFAVAWVVRNRADEWHKTITDVILAPHQFSWLNEDYRDRAMARLAAADGPEAEHSWMAAAAGLWKLSESPVNNATHYLNPVAVRLGRPKHDLPDWAADPLDNTRVDPLKLIAVIGRHHFLRA